MKRCFACQHAALRPATHPDTLEVDGLTFTAELPAWLCTHCGEVYVAGDGISQFEKAVAAKLADLGRLSGEAFRFMRKALGLRATDLATMLDVTPETISHWETTKRAIPRATWALLGALCADATEGRSATRDRLQAARTPAHPRTPIRLAVRAA